MRDMAAENGGGHMAYDIMFFFDLHHLIFP